MSTPKLVLRCAEDGTIGEVAQEYVVASVRVAVSGYPAHNMIWVLNPFGLKFQRASLQ